MGECYHATKEVIAKDLEKAKAETDITGMLDLWEEPVAKQKYLGALCVCGWWT